MSLSSPSCSRRCASRAIAFVFRLPRKAWTLVLTALVLGLAGYADAGAPPTCRARPACRP